MLTGPAWLQRAAAKPTVGLSLGNETLLSLQGQPIDSSSEARANELAKHKQPWVVSGAPSLASQFEGAGL